MSTSGAAVRIELALSDGTHLSSRITQESAQLLDLTRGRDVLALCKATAVSVTCVGSGVASNNTLVGRVVRVSGDTGAVEVSMKLDCGLSMVGFASDAGKLSVGDACAAQIDDSSVVIALAG